MSLDKFTITAEDIETGMTFLRLRKPDPTVRTHPSVRSICEAAVLTRVLHMGRRDLEDFEKAEARDYRLTLKGRFL